jgi:hypothetical protein
MGIGRYPCIIILFCDDCHIYPLRHLLTLLSNYKLYYPMNMKETIDAHEASPLMEENCLHSAENTAYYDSQIKKSILVSLSWYSDVRVEELTILVNHGFVCVYGVVPWMYQKLMITAAIRRIIGVTDLCNNICAASQFLEPAR